METTTSPDLCADCRQAPVRVRLPEGRNLCRPCWRTLKALRIHVLQDMALRRKVARHAG